MPAARKLKDTASTACPKSENEGASQLSLKSPDHRPSRKGPTLNPKPSNPSA